jgi:putative transposase
MRSDDHPAVRMAGSVKIRLLRLEVPAAERGREKTRAAEIKVKALFEANNEEYGYRRMHAVLVRGGEQCCPELVRGLMRELGLEPCQPKPWRHSLTEQDGQAGPIPDLVNRDFTADEPGRKMVGDITYIDTWEGWVYLLVTWNPSPEGRVGRRPSSPARIPT